MSEQVNEPSDTSSQLRAEFARLAEEWREQSKYLSSSTAMAELPSYRAIIAMGEAAIPLILEDLRREPDHWFMALVRITGVSPVPPEARGQIDRMAEAWLEWGREHGYEPRGDLGFQG